MGRVGPCHGVLCSALGRTMGNTLAQENELEPPVFQGVGRVEHRDYPLSEAPAAPRHTPPPAPAPPAWFTNRTELNLAGGIPQAPAAPARNPLVPDWVYALREEREARDREAEERAERAANFRQREREAEERAARRRERNNAYWTDDSDSDEDDGIPAPPWAEFEAANPAFDPQSWDEWEPDEDSPPRLPPVVVNPPTTTSRPLPPDYDLCFYRLPSYLEADAADPMFWLLVRFILDRTRASGLRTSFDNKDLAHSRVVIALGADPMQDTRDRFWRIPEAAGTTMAVYLIHEGEDERYLRSKQAALRKIKDFHMLGTREYARGELGLRHLERMTIKGRSVKMDEHTSHFLERASQLVAVR